MIAVFLQSVEKASAKALAAEALDLMMFFEAAQAFQKIFSLPVAYLLSIERLEENRRFWF